MYCIMSSQTQRRRRMMCIRWMICILAQPLRPRPPRIKPQMRSTQSELPFTSSTYLWCERRSSPEPLQPARRASSASSRWRFSPLKEGGERPRRPRSSSVLSLFFITLSLPFFLLRPSPCYSPPPRVLSSLSLFSSQRRADTSPICGTTLATWSRRRIPGSSNAPRRTGTARVAPQPGNRNSSGFCRDGTWRLAHPGTTPSNVTGKRELDPGASPSSSTISLIPRPPPSLLLPSPICGTSQPTSTQAATLRTRSESVCKN